MGKRFIFFFALFLPSLLFAQKDIFTDPAERRILENDCHGKLFEKVEELPSLKISPAAYADSLASFLRAKGVRFKAQSVVFSFIVTPKPELLDLTKYSGEVRKQKQFEEAILKFSNLWIPAKQNGHIVCASIKLKLSTHEDQLTFEIFQ